MKIATFADLHVGVSTYGHIDPNTGLNTRVLDALNSFDEIIDYCINNSINQALVELIPYFLRIKQRYRPEHESYQLQCVEMAL